jgi:hypothetical protein
MMGSSLLSSRMGSSFAAPSQGKKILVLSTDPKVLLVGGLIGALCGALGHSLYKVLSRDDTEKRRETIIYRAQAEATKLSRLIVMRRSMEAAEKLRD